MRVLPRCAAVDCVLLRVSACVGGAFGVFWARFDFFVTASVFFVCFCVFVLLVVMWCASMCQKNVCWVCLGQKNAANFSEWLSGRVVDRVRSVCRGVGWGGRAGSVRRLRVV